MYNILYSANLSAEFIQRNASHTAPADEFVNQEFFANFISSTNQHAIIIISITIYSGLFSRINYQEFIFKI